MKTILRVLVGSRAHGLHDESSDYDYRGVFVEPTSEILKLGSRTRTTSWIEHGDTGLTDDTAWEVAHFLHLATKCNPSILEVFAAPVIEANHWGRELQELLPYVWNPKAVRDAFIGYGLNQRKKMLEDKDTRPAKYAYSYIRVLASGMSLLTTGAVLVDMRGHEVFETLQRFKTWDGVSKGEVIDVAERWQQRIGEAAADCQHVPDLDYVNDYLLRLRQEYW